MAHVFGADQYLNWDSSGGASWKSVGGVTAGRMPKVGYDRRKRKYISLQRQNRAGRNRYNGNANIDVIGDTLAFFETACCYTAGGILTPVKLDGDMGRGEVVHDPAYISEFDLMFAADECAKLNVSWIGKALGTGGQAAAVAATDLLALEDYETTIELDGDDLDFSTVSIKGKNPVNAKSYIRNGTIGLKRNPSDVTAGPVPDYTVDITCDLEPTFDLTADCPADTHELVVTMVSTCAAVPNTWTITVSNLMWSGDPGEDFNPDDDNPIPWNGTLEQGDYSRIIVTS